MFCKSAKWIAGHALKIMLTILKECERNDERVFQDLVKVANL